MSVGTSGPWLFRKEGLVLGPVTAEQLIKELYAGALDGQTPVSRVGEGRFRLLGEVELFRKDVQKAAIRARVQKDLAAEAEARTKHRVRRWSVGMGLTAAGMLVAALAGYRLAVDNPFKRPERMAYAGLEVSLVGVRVETARPQDTLGDMVDSPYVAPPPGRRPVERPADPAPAAAEQPLAVTPPAARPQLPPVPVAPAGRAVAGRRSEDSPDSDGLQTGQFDRNSINLVVAAHKKTLHSCLVAEAEKRPGLVAKIPIEFVIGNDGRVARVWVDHPSFQSGSLPDCLLRELKKWPFKAYPGEQATVSLAFKIGQQG